MLGSPSDIEPNSFLDHNIDLSGPIVPRWFRLAIPVKRDKRGFYCDKQR